MRKTSLHFIDDRSFLHESRISYCPVIFNSKNGEMDKRKFKMNNIIADSIHLLYEKGYNGVGIQEILESANIPKGAVYAYFKNKEDYLLKSLVFFYSKMEESVLLPLDDKKTKPLNRIHNFFIAEKKAIDSRRERTSLMIGCYIGNTTQELAKENNIIRKTVNELLNNIDNKIYKCLEEGRNDLKNGIDIKDFSGFLLDSMHGSFFKSKSCGIGRTNRTIDKNL